MPDGQEHAQPDADATVDVGAAARGVDVTGGAWSQVEGGPDAGERKQRVLAVFRNALALAPPQRRSFIEQACGADDGARVMVESMLRQYLARKLAEVTGDGEESTCEPGESPFADPLIGQTVGSFRIRRHIASGGMGSIYEAVQKKPRRVVALKVMLRGIATRSALRRLDFEAQLLGRLHHPGVAQVYEAGTFNDGQGDVPYFAMEYIPNARTLTEYAAFSHLSTRSRLELFEKVCDAVHHGHQKGIIHRDLKPSNILVDASRQPKVIDFGVARSTDSDMAITTLQTDVGQLIGTLQYMSPEQCDADPHSLDTRSDVYSLGVVLYELLCERLPYDIAGVPIHDAARVIRETAPPRPSSVDRTLRGDIETIVLKAMEKDRNLRYQSAIELKQDISRYLQSEAIRARRPGSLTQITRFASRHRTAFIGIVLVLLVLLGGTAFSIPFAISANRARDEAVAAAADAAEAKRVAEASLDAAHEKVYAYEILAANEAEEQQRLGALVRHLENTPEPYRGWEYRYLHRQAQGRIPPIGFDASVVGVSADRDGRQLAVALDTGAAWLVTRAGPATRRVAVESSGLTSFAMSHDGATLALGYEDELRIRSTRNNPAEREFRGTGSLAHVTFSGDDALVAAASVRNVRVWRLRPKRNRLGTIKDRPEPISAIALSPDGRRIAIAYESGGIEVWDPHETDEALFGQALHRGKVAALTFDRRGRLLASGGEDRSIVIWNMETSRIDRIADGHAGPVGALTFNRDGTRLFSGSEDATIRLWDVDTQVWVMTLRGHEDAVSSLAISGDGCTLVSGSRDGHVRIWEAEPAEQ